MTQETNYGLCKIKNHICKIGQPITIKYSSKIVIFYCPVLMFYSPMFKLKLKYSMIKN